ncbi:hypothetical protein FBQ88_12455 [Gammaproteobacteria bacterium PRO2]|nr:hypothetical protein [Gammaproteobacteria bacterium PRO2]
MNAALEFPRNKHGGWVVPPWAALPDGVVVPTCSEIGDCVKIGDHATIGHEATIGDEATIGNYVKIGDEATIGRECVIEGVKVKRILTLGNVDGSGRQVLLIWHAGGVLVRAGCFRGTVGEFVARAAREGKHIYAAVIPAVVAAVEGR